MFILYTVVVHVSSMHRDDEAPLQCNTEKDKGRFQHHTAGKHNGNYIVISCMRLDFGTLTISPQQTVANNYSSAYVATAS